MFLKQTSYKPKGRSNSQSSSGSPPPTPDATPDASTTTAPRRPSQSQAWEDRRFMFPTGRRSSSSASASAGVADALQQKTSSPFSMSKPNTSENPHPAAFKAGAAGATGTEGAEGALPVLRDRHVIWSKGREIHETATERERRKSSASSATAKSGMLANLLGYGGGTAK